MYDKSSENLTRGLKFSDNTDSRGIFLDYDLKRDWNKVPDINNSVWLLRRIQLNKPVHKFETMKGIFRQIKLA